MASQLPVENLDKLLIGHLFDKNKTLAAFAQVIVNACAILTKGSPKNDFAHSKEVHWRLSQLLSSDLEYAINETEIFILCASSYLHDIGRSGPEKKHGESSAKMINTRKDFNFLFPASDIRNQVAKICYYHDRHIRELEELDERLSLDLRYTPAFTLPKLVEIRPRFLAALFRLADELECSSDRLLSNQSADEDSRGVIAAVRIDSKTRSICLDYKLGCAFESQRRCKNHVADILSELESFLKPHGLSFSVVDSMLGKRLDYEPEESNPVFSRIDGSEDIESIAKMEHSVGNFEQIFADLNFQRMSRVDSVISILQRKGTKQ